jgi:hypothetical protein
MPYCNLCFAQDSHGRGGSIGTELHEFAQQGVNVLRVALGVHVADTAYLCSQHIAWLRTTCVTANTVQDAHKTLVVPVLQDPHATRGATEVRLKHGREEHRVPPEWESFAHALVSDDVAVSLETLYLADRNDETETNGVLRGAINGCVHAAIRCEAKLMCSDKHISAFHTQPTRDLTKLGPEVMIDAMFRDLNRSFSTWKGILCAVLTRETKKGTYTATHKDSTPFAFLNATATMLSERSERVGQLPLMKGLLARDAGETRQGQERASLFKDQASYSRTLLASHALRDDPRELLGAWRHKRERKMELAFKVEISASRKRLAEFLKQRRHK